MTPCPNCSWPHHATIPITLNCARCGAVVVLNGGSEKTKKSKPKPERNRNDPKAEARLIGWVKMFRKPEDTGVGDTVERLLAKVGGKAIEKSLKRLGINCGCKSRQKWLNQRYPY